MRTGVRYGERGSGEWGMGGGQGEELRAGRGMGSGDWRDGKWG